jgi:hypothetical protein
VNKLSSQAAEESKTGNVAGLIDTFRSLSSLVAKIPHGGALSKADMADPTAHLSDWMDHITALVDKNQATLVGKKLATESPAKIESGANALEYSNAEKSAAEQQVLAADKSQIASDAAKGVADKGLQASAAHLQASITQLSAANAQIAYTASALTDSKTSSTATHSAATTMSLAAQKSEAAAEDHKLAAKDTSTAAKDMVQASTDVESGNTTAANRLETAASALNTAAKTLSAVTPASISAPPSGASAPRISIVPHHAAGAVTTGASVGVIGEAGPEAVLPLSNSSAMASVASAIADAGGGAGSGLAGSNTTNYVIQNLTIVAQNPAQMEQQLQQRARVSALSGRPSGGTNLGVAV